MKTLQFPTPATGHSHTAQAGEPMRYHSFPDLIAAYLATLKGRTQTNSRLTAAQWMRTLTTTPTRKEILARHTAKGHGHFQPGASQANNELALMRAACRWGLYQECWDGGDPTAGVKKWQTPRRKRVAKFDELKQLLEYFDRAFTDQEIRDRAIFGLMLFTGCRPGEARTAKLDSITAYGEMGCWKKGKTKNGEEYEVPLPAQLMPWIAAWKAIRPKVRPNSHLFPGLKWNQPIGTDWVVNRWHELGLMLGIRGLWNYDIRRSLATHLSNELGYADAVIDAILGHEKTSSLGHYLHVSFDAMTKPIQHYADWLWALRHAPKGERDEPPPVHVRPVISIPTPPPPVTVSPAVGTSNDPMTDAPKLSAREGEVLARFAQGQSCAEIAGHLGLSIQAINTYRARLLRKLHVSSTAGLIRYAIEQKADVPVSIPAQPMMPASVPIAYRSHSMEREEWPG